MADLSNNIRHMARYNTWANTRVYEACDAAGDEVRKRAVGASFASIHGTLNHLLVADRLWLGRFTGVPFAVAGLDVELYSDFAELRDARAETDAAMERHVGGLSPDELVQPFRFRNLKGDREFRLPLIHCLLHVFNHQTHHRGQIVHMLRASGIAPPATDLLLLPDAQEGWI